MWTQKHNQQKLKFTRGATTNFEAFALQSKLSRMEGRAGAVAQRLKPQPAVPASHMGTSSSPRRISDPTPC